MADIVKISDATALALHSMVHLAIEPNEQSTTAEIAQGFDASRHHLAKVHQRLTKAGLISQEKRGRVKWCKLEPDAMRDAAIWMQSFGQYDALNIDALEAFLEAQDLSIDKPS